jgi:hypothetical protein
LVRTDGLAQAGGLVQADELVQAEAGSKRNANIGMAQKAAWDAGCAASAVDFCRKQYTHTHDIDLICSKRSPGDLRSRHRGITTQ